MPTEINIPGTPGSVVPKPADPSYGVSGPRVMPYGKPPEAPSLRQEMEGNWELSLVDQGYYRLREYLGNAPDPNFNPWDHLDGYELYADSLVTTRSLGEIQQMKARIDKNQQTREMLARGEWGWMASLLSGAGDPLNLVPIPGAMGMGFVKGATFAAAGNAALAAATAPLALAADPTTNWEEQAYSVGGAALFGAAFGGVAGMIGRKARAASRKGMEDFSVAQNVDEGMNISRAFNAREEEFDVLPGNTRTLNEDGVYEPVFIRDVTDLERSKPGPDGQLYHYDDTHGWVLEADRGSDTPRPISEDVKDALGTPEPVRKRQMLLDEAALRAEYERGAWKDELGADALRSPEEFITFRQLEAVNRRQEPKLDSESPQAFRQRTRASALQEIRDGRASSEVMRKSGIEYYLDKLNRSPVAKAIRLFSGDNILTDLPLQIGGDYGWAIRANKFGYKTPPSVLVRSLKHGAAFVEAKQALDAEWLKHVQKNSQARGTMFMSQNITASAEALRATGRSMLRQKVLTKEIFSKMAGRAVFDPGDFEINGIPVVPEARAAAKAFTRIAQRYDKRARELGIFYDQTSLKRTVSNADAKLVRLKGKAAQWLWGGRQAPSKLHPAVKVGDQMFFGDSHEQAAAAAMDALGPDVKLTPESYGYVDNLATSNDQPAPVGPPPVEPGFTRFYRGQAPGDAAQWATPSTGRWFTTDLEDARQFAKSADGTVFYVDLSPADMKGVVSGAANPDKWFILDERLSGRKAYFEGKNPSNDDPTLAPKAALKQPKFRPMDDVLQSRIDSLSPAQRQVWDDMAADIDALTQRRDQAKLELQNMSDSPHVFRDQFGNPEPYFARFWHKAEIAEKRAQFEKLLTHWYRRDNPLGAEERAAKTVDDMLKADTGLDEDTGVPGLAHLHKRGLDIPNSFRVNDQELGELAIADFIETDMEIVAETYTRTMGAKIETAEMFGDTELFDKMQEIKQHFRERYLLPALEAGKDITPILGARDEYLGWVRLTRDAVLGGLRNKEAYNFSNRIARDLKNVQVLNSLGRVLLTAAPEAMRLPMVNGFGTAFKAIWTRLFTDLKEIKANVEMSRLTGGLFEMAIDRRNAEIASLGHVDPHGGGKWIERKIERMIPPFFKLVGLSQWTVMMKDITMFATQHRIIDLARKVDDGDNQAVLAAMGISRRDAKLIASMPVDEHPTGLVLPGVDRWEGPEGRRARQLFLDALVGEANRAVITPSIADKSLLFSGVYARKGKKVAESDWFSVPLQFMSFGIAANQKLLMSALQGRDHNMVGGALAMLVAGVISNYMRTPSSAMMNKSFDELLLEGYEASGLGGFWFGDLNGQIERFTRHQIGIRPILGMDPKFGKTTDVGDYVDILGPAPSTWFDVANAFIDPEKSMTNRAQTIRRAIPFNNVIWWGGVTRDLTTLGAKAISE